MFLCVDSISSVIIGIGSMKFSMIWFVIIVCVMLQLSVIIMNVGVIVIVCCIQSDMWWWMKFCIMICLVIVLIIEFDMFDVSSVMRNSVLVIGLSIGISV